MPITLSEAEVESVREMVGDLTFSTVQSLCDDLNDAQRSAMQEDVESWDAKKNSHLRMSGGSDGIDLDSQRLPKALRRRVRLRLGLSAGGSLGGIFQIPVGVAYPDYC